jgi:hypothetical protein
MSRHRALRASRGVLLAAILLVGCAFVAAACSRPPDAQKVLQVTDLTTGWYDAGIVNGKNKLVPTVSFRVKNVGTSTVKYVQLNAVFRVIGDQEELGSMFVKGIGGDGLAAGAHTETYVLRSALGYTGEQPRHEMLDHSGFRDAKVEIFAKPGSSQWVKLAEHTVARQLLTR